MDHIDNYLEGNKAAWEDAFEHRKPGWGDDNHEVIKTQRLAFFNPAMQYELEQIDFADKTVAQICCNNGRELLSLAELGIRSGTGFDFAENIIQQAKDTAEKAGIDNCEFVACNIRDIPESYHGQFDIIFSTVGTLTWFDELSWFFEKVEKCLKPDGLILVNDIHPFMNMLPIPGEEPFDQDNLDRVTYSYFRNEPWVENGGMEYMSVAYESKTFICFPYTMAELINALADNGLKATRFLEFDFDIGLTEVYDGKGLPLSFILIAEKN